MGRSGVYVACGVVTVFLLANSYETTFGQTLPFVNAVEKVDLGFLQPSPNAMIPKLGKQTSSVYEGNYGTPAQLRIAATSKNITIATPIYHQHSWLARASTAHYIVTTPAKEGDLGDTIVYMTGGRTTMADDEAGKITPGSNIYLYTKRNWRYMYRVNETATLSASQPYVLSRSNTSRLYAVIQDGPNRTVIAASLTNVQSADQQ